MLQLCIKKVTNILNTKLRNKFLKIIKQDIKLKFLGKNRSPCLQPREQRVCQLSSNESDLLVLKTLVPSTY